MFAALYRILNYQTSLILAYSSPDIISTLSPEYRLVSLDGPVCAIYHNADKHGNSALKVGCIRASARPIAMTLCKYQRLLFVSEGENNS